MTEQLLGHIPRLENVRSILAGWAGARRMGAAAVGEDAQVGEGAEVLRAAVDYDVLEAQGNASTLALDVLRGRGERYDPRVLEALAEVRGGAGSCDELRELPVAAIRVGMVVAEDVRMLSGVLLVARGAEITPGFVERLRNFRGTVKEPVRVLVRRGRSVA